MVEASGEQKGWSTRRSLHKSERSCQDPRVWSGCSPHGFALVAGRSCTLGPARWLKKLRFVYYRNSGLSRDYTDVFSL